MTLSNYNKFISGEWKLTLPIVCNDGQIRSVRIEQYVEGFAFFMTKDDGEYTNHTCYKTSQKAINAAARAYIGILH
jgi:hypothetical protein